MDKDLLKGIKFDMDKLRNVEFTNNINQMHNRGNKLAKQVMQQNAERDERELQMLEYTKQSAETAEEMHKYARWSSVENAKVTDKAMLIAGTSLFVSVISIIVSIIIAVVD